MRQLIKDTLVMVSMLSLMSAAGLIPGTASALTPLPMEKSKIQPDASADDEKMAADASDSDDADDLPGKKAKKSHKAKMDTKETDDIVAGKEDDAGTLDMQGDNRIKMLLYDEADVYTITTRYGYQTNVVFSPQEEIELVSVGDRSLWQIIPSGHRMFIRPMEEDVVTNMTVLTNKRSYQFDLKSLPSGKSGNIYVAQFVYGTPKKPAPMMDALPAATPSMPVQQGMMAPAPASSPFAVSPSIPSGPAPVAAQNPVQSQLQGQPVMSQPMPVPPSQPVAPQPVQQMQASMPPAGAPAYPNYSYTYSGPDEVAPLQVYDDGRATYLKYNDVARLSPSAFVVDPAGRETPISYSVKGDYIVVDGVVGELALKSNGNVVHVFNEMINPG